jgi:hypothetical protein
MCMHEIMHVNLQPFARITSLHALTGQAQRCVNHMASSCKWAWHVAQTLWGGAGSDGTSRLEPEEGFLAPRGGCGRGASASVSSETDAAEVEENLIGAGLRPHRVDGLGDGQQRRRLPASSDQLRFVATRGFGLVCPLVGVFRLAAAFV